MSNNSNSSFDTGKIISKKEIPESKDLKKAFKTTLVPFKKLQKYYEEGYKEVSSHNVINKILEMGILVDIDLKDDYNTREIDFIPQEFKPKEHKEEQELDNSI